MTPASNTRSMAWGVFFRLFGLQTALAVGAVFSFGLASHLYFKSHFAGQVKVQLHDALITLSKDLNTIPNENWCARHAEATELRFSLIDATTGALFCDSHIANTPKNVPLLERPEVKQALKEGYGSVVRSSFTLKNEAAYGALRVLDGRYVLRGGLSLEPMTQIIKGFDRFLGMVGALLTLAVAVLSFLQARHTAGPIGALLNRAKKVNETPFASEHEESIPSDAGFGELRELSALIDRIGEERRDDLTQSGALLGLMSDGVLALNREGEPLYYNSRFVLLCGLPMECLKIPRWRSFVEKALNYSGDSPLEQEIVQQGPRGVLYFSVKASPLEASKEKNLGILLLVRDVTAIRQVAQAKSDFVANASHELRTPLSSIKGYSDTLLMRLDKGQEIGRSLIEPITRNCTRMLELTGQLLRLSEVDHPTDDYQKEFHSVEALTEKVLLNISQGFESQKQLVSVSYDVKEVFGDAIWIEQVLTNLLTNAQRYSGLGATIGVSWTRGLTIEASVLTVKDTGPGIAPEHLERLFERFYRVDKNRSRKLGGSGLGLALVKHVLESHGGKVQVESTVDKGTVFVCTFPLPNQSQSLKT